MLTRSWGLSFNYTEWKIATLRKEKIIKSNQEVSLKKIKLVIYSYCHIIRKKITICSSEMRVAIMLQSTFANKTDRCELNEIS